MAKTYLPTRRRTYTMTLKEDADPSALLSKLVDKLYFGDVLTEDGQIRRLRTDCWSILVEEGKRKLVLEWQYKADYIGIDHFLRQLRGDAGEIESAVHSGNVKEWEGVESCDGFEDWDRVLPPEK